MVRTRSVGPLLAQTGLTRRKRDGKKLKESLTMPENYL